MFLTTSEGYVFFFSSTRRNREVDRPGVNSDFDFHCTWSLVSYAYSAAVFPMHP